MKSAAPFGSAALQPVTDQTREAVAALELRVAERERALAEFKTDLLSLQSRYLDEIGPLYAELIPLDAAVREAEIKAGVRVPSDDELDDDPRAGMHRSASGLTGCGPASSVPSLDLKRMFRDVARAVHPDRSPQLEMDERTRYRRHSLMAEANRAYAERDEDRLRLILRAWEMDPDFAADDDPDAERARRQRRAAALGSRLVEIETEFADLRRSAIARLKNKIDEARTQGWDLFAEMLRQITREIGLAKAKLVRLVPRRV